MKALFFFTPPIKCLQVFKGVDILPDRQDPATEPLVIHQSNRFLKHELRSPRNTRKNILIEGSLLEAYQIIPTIGSRSDEGEGGQSMRT